MRGRGEKHIYVCVCVLCMQRTISRNTVRNRKGANYALIELSRSCAASELKQRRRRGNAHTHAHQPDIGYKWAMCKEQRHDTQFEILDVLCLFGLLNERTARMIDRTNNRGCAVHSGIFVAFKENRSTETRQQLHSNTVLFLFNWFDPSVCTVYM